MRLGHEPASDTLENHGERPTEITCTSHGKGSMPLISAIALCCAVAEKASDETRASTLEVWANAGAWAMRFSRNVRNAGSGYGSEIMLFKSGANV
jgi:hypothetical protein